MHRRFEAVPSQLRLEARRRHCACKPKAIIDEFERSNGLVACDRRELAEKLVNGVATLQIVEERLDRNTRSHEHRCEGMAASGSCVQRAAGPWQSRLSSRCSVTPHFGASLPSLVGSLCADSASLRGCTQRPVARPGAS